ncbi:hypothetical protein BC940DRAFT_322880 [Gongronella butleri]|nr:hypothetical protein BC940DRAFT_322880 [Gongronella butleri]
MPGEAPKKVFHCVGMNVAKAQVKQGKLQSTSRELTYYLDPETNEKLSKWTNPWTAEQCPVVHIANDPVQMALPVFIPWQPRTTGSTSTTFVTEVPLFYPNPLYSEDGTFDDYDEKKMYQAGEFFTFKCATAELEKDASTLDDVDVNWTRVCPFPPFMKMGTYEREKRTQGYLVYHCSGRKLPQGSTYKDLTAKALRDDLEHVIPSYRTAPACYDPDAKSISSWTYFKQHFDRYCKDPDAPWPIPE